MKFKHILIVICLSYSFNSTLAQNGTPIHLKSVTLNKATLEMLKGVEIEGLRMDRKGAWTVSSEYSILLYEKAGRLVFQRKGEEIITYNGKEKFPGGIVVHCGGCSNGCQPYRTPRGKITYYGCTQCSENSKYQAGCLSAVEVPSKGIVDRETLL